MLAVFLGAGFSYVAGVPMAGDLFREEPKVDLLVRKKLVDRVLSGWTNWHLSSGGTPEQYISYLNHRSAEEMRDATWYVALVIAIKMGILQQEGEPTITLQEPRDGAARFRLSVPNSRSYISHHDVNRTTSVFSHEEFWNTIFHHTSEVGVITTNYDILAERGLRLSRRPQVRRPGFHYGLGPEKLYGRGNSWVPKKGIFAEGDVPLIKLHGSISWALEGGSIRKYLDCRPAIRGDALIVAPVHEKRPSTELLQCWLGASQILSNSKTWVIVGYSFPIYDAAAIDLFVNNAGHHPSIHIFDPNAKVADKVRNILPKCEVTQYLGLPSAMGDLASICYRVEEARWRDQRT